MDKLKYPLRFSGRNIPVAMAAKIIGKDAQFIRQGMIEGVLPIGAAYKKRDATQYDFYISPKLFYEFSGFYFEKDLIPFDEYLDEG